MGNKLRSPTYIGDLKLSDGPMDKTLYVDDAPLISPDLNIQNGTGDYSLIQKEASGKQGQATGNGSIAFGGFRGDKPNDSPNPIPNDDASVNNLDQDEYNDTISKVTGIQSYVFGAGNRAYGNWSFIMGKDSKTCSRAAYIFGSKNYVGNPNNGNMYLHSMAVGSLNSVNSTNTFVAGTQNTVTNTDGAVALGIGNSITNNGYAVGIANTLTSNYSVALGNMNTLSATYGGALGTNNTIYGAYGKAIGTSNTVNANFGITIGNGLSSSTEYQILLGKYNRISASSDILLALGNGTDTNNRSNAFEITTTGVVRAYGKPVGSYDVVRKRELDTKISKDSPVINSPLTLSGGDGPGAAKIRLNERQYGQITDSNTSTLFGFTDSSSLKVGHSFYGLQLRGSATRPTYNGNDVALKNDLLPKLPDASSDGMYVLKATKSDNTITYSWVM